MSGAQETCFGIGLTREQGALVMEALAERPFRTVFALIGRLNAWANQAFAEPTAQQGQPLFALSGAELALVLQALAELPHRRVHALIGSLQAQLERTQADASHG